MMLKALPLVHFWSILLLKEQMMTSVRKTLKMLVWSAQNRSIFSEFCPKNNQKIRRFLTIALWPSFPQNWLIFPQFCPQKSHKIWLFFSATYQKPWFLESFNGPFSSSLSDIIIILIIISDNPTPCNINFKSNQKVFLEEFRPCQENIILSHSEPCSYCTLCS